MGEIYSIIKNNKWDERIPPVSIVTSVYNRKEELIRAIDSVNLQTIKNFEYIIVDNGSEVVLDDIVLPYMNSSDFPVCYVKKAFGGPHEGRNAGKIQSRGKYLVTLDSDDELVPNAIETLFKTWEGLKEKDQYWEVVCLCKNQNNEIVGYPFPSNINAVSTKEANKLCMLTKGEHFSMDLAELHREYLFPEPPNVTYITEKLVWDKIKKRGYKSFYINEALRVYHTDTSDSITLASRKTTIQYVYNNYWAKQYVLNHWKEYPYSFVDRIGYVFRLIVFYRILRDKKSSFLTQKTCLNGVVNRILYALFFVPGICYSKVYENKKMR